MARARWATADVFDSGSVEADTRWQAAMVAAALALVVSVLAVPFARFAPTATNAFDAIEVPAAGAPSAAIPAEYHLVEAGRGWSAPNPAGLFDTAFTSGGVRVTAATGGAALGLELARVGRGGQLARPAPAHLEADGARIEYQRGAVTEWYVNDPSGLEQGITLAEAPRGRAGGPVVVELAPIAGFRPELSADGTSITLGGSGSTFTYGGLHAFDADGDALPAHLGVDGGRIALSVDDAGADYPITIDPIVTTLQSQLTAPGSAVGDSYGAAVAVSGDTAVVGAPHRDANGTDSGSAYVFTRSGTTWTYRTTLAPTTPGAGTGFGASVDISGGTIVVGASEDLSGGGGRGAAYVFVGSGASWSQQAQLLDPEGSSVGDEFGTSVGIDGDRVVVGSPHWRKKSISQAQAGSAFVYQRTGTSWAFQSRLHADAEIEGDWFGQAVAIDGTTIAVGVPFDSNQTDPDGGGPVTVPTQGSFYVFAWDGSAWVVQGNALTGSTTADNDRIGAGVAVSGDRVAATAGVGGKVYVFHRSGSTWTQEDQLPAPAQGGLGSPVAIAGDSVLVGDPGSNATQIYRRIGSDWAAQPRIAGFGGTALGMDGTTAVIGGFESARALTLTDVAPTVTVQADVGVTNDSASSWDVRFSAPVTGFTASDVVADGSTSGSISIDDDFDTDASTYRVIVSNVTVDGTVRIRIPAGAAIDGAGIGSALSTSTADTTTFDFTRPTVTLARGAGQASPSSARPIHFTLTASEDIRSGPGDIDVDVSSSAGAVTTTITPATPGSKRVFDVAVDGMSISGRVTANVPVNGVQDPANNFLAAPSAFPYVDWVDDNTAPKVSFPAGITATEGVARSLAGIVTDSDGDAAITWTAVRQSGADAGATCALSDAHAISPTITCSNEGTWLVSATADDGVNPVASDGQPIQVDNAAPLLGTITYPDTAAPGVTITASATATDPGPRDVLTCAVHWGDSTSSSGTISSGTCSATHAYAAAGRYRITMDLTDDVGANMFKQAAGDTVVAVGSQTITFPAPATPVTYGAAPFSLAPTASSGLPVSLGVVGTGCSLSKATAPATVTITDGGGCTITASQAGNAQFRAAEDVERSVSINKAALTVTASPASMVYGGTPTAVTPTYAGFVNGDGPSDLQPVTCRLDFAPSSYGAGVHPAETSCSGGFSTKYQPTFVPGTLTVAKAPATITAVDTTSTYGDSQSPHIDLTVTGLVNGDGVSSIGQPSCEGWTFRLAVGTYADALTCSGATAANYDISYRPGDLTITKAPLTIKASNATTPYGTAATVTPVYSGFVLGESAAFLATPPTCTSGSTAASVGVHAGATSCFGAVDESYSFTYAKGDLTVTKAALTAAAPDATMEYGDAPVSVAPTITGFVNGDDASDLDTRPTCTGGSTTTPAGSYAGAVTCSGGADGSYSFSYTAGDLTITKAPLTITAPASGMEYGSTPPTSQAAFTPTYSGFKNGQGASVLVPRPSCTTVGTSTLGVGIYPTGVSCAAAGSPNYEITYVAGPFTVRPAALTVTPSPVTMTYGGPAPARTPQIAGFKNGETAAVLTAPVTCAPPSTSLPVAQHTGIGGCSGGAAANYTFTYLGGAVTVEPAVLTVTAPDATMAYGGPGVVVTPTYTGFVNGDDASVVADTAPVCVGGSPDLAPGLHPGAIVCSGGSAANYTFAFVAGDLTVEQAVVTVTASDATMAYGGAAPTVTPQYSGFRPGDDQSVITTPARCTSIGTPTTPAGPHVGGTSCSGAVAAGYTVQYVAGDLTVTKAPLTITASDGTMTYGGTPPAVTASYAGFRNGETSAVLSAQPTCGGGSSTTPAGAHLGATSCAGAQAANYEISYAKGTLTVAKAPLTITASDATMVYGADGAIVTASYDGFVNGEGASALSTQPACSGGSTTVPAGAHADATSCTGAEAASYEIGYATGDLTVTKAPLTITASPGAMTYGGTPPTITPSFTGLVHGQDPAVLSAQPTCSGGTPTTPAGTYADGTSCSGATAANYEISYVGGTLTVGKATLTVTADDLAKGPDQPVPPLTYTVTGFVNGEGPSVLSGAPALSTTATATSVAGTYPITVGVGTLDAASYRFALVNGRLTVAKSPTAIVTAPVVLELVPLRLVAGGVSARLTQGAGNVPVAGQPVTFTAGTTVLCTAVTGADGIASCKLKVAASLTAILRFSVTATFDGNGNLEPSSNKGPLIKV